MSDLKDRVGVITGGNANLIKDPGDIITGDGDQTVYLRNPNVGGASDGFVLVLDSLAEEGLSWAPAAGGLGLTEVTGSNGVTVTPTGVSTRNATNDLVTGTDVAQLNVDSLGPATIDAPTGAANGILLTATAGGSTDDDPTLNLGRAAGSGQIRARLSAGVVSLRASGQTIIESVGGETLNTFGTAGVSLSAVGSGIPVSLSGDGGILLTSGGVAPAPADGEIDITALSDIRLTSDASVVIAAGNDGSGSVSLLSGATSGNITAFAEFGNIDFSTDNAGDILIRPDNDALHTSGRDETHTVGRNFTVTAAGATGVNITATDGNLILDAGPGDGTGEVRVMPTAGAPAATRTFRIWNGAGAGQQDGAINPAGGVVQDAEMRAAFDTLLNYLYAWGWVTNPTP